MTMNTNRRPIGRTNEVFFRRPRLLSPLVELSEDIVADRLVELVWHALAAEDRAGLVVTLRGLRRPSSLPKALTAHDCVRARALGRRPASNRARPPRRQRSRPILPGGP